MESEALLDHRRRFYDLDAPP
ncbi:hypothetical protein CHGG_01585 [Chaetomium globosum CBS 148.51]|uniref:Uncharacterized protein n=1 Tax=Chaetomium globosum (strain ATCC 6205 / CBS 148.51 / DSM 1962 / NBRC 6347 / NRRL 1970) TaxID=306901 RepID=Q2HDW9_CHAGB|nr:hypothetical protein CHGG_01585 [Chaetomium globosum CBS 148.51]